MSSLKLLLAEVGYRKLNFLLSLLAVAAAVTLLVASPLLVAGYGQRTQRVLAGMDASNEKLISQIDGELAKLDDETRKLMITMGFNLMIVHEDTNMADFWAEDFADQTMPEEYVYTLAESPRLSLVRHLVATLQEKIKWNDRSVLLVGYLPEVTQTHFGKKKPMGHDVPEGKVLLGYELWKSLDFPPGTDVKDEEVEVLGRKFQIAGLLPEQGSKEDITIAMHLNDAQELLEKPDRISQIMALGCRCEGERLPKIRAQLEDVLPQTKITEFRSIALARAEQREVVAQKRDEVNAQHLAARKQVQAEYADIRQSIERLAAVVTPLVVLGCGIWVGLLALANVRERREEIGLLRALGRGSASIAALFLGRAVLVGIVGGAAGYLLGVGISEMVAARAFDVSNLPAFSLPLLLGALLGAPLICAMASYLPTLRAVTQDPAIVLRDT